MKQLTALNNERASRINICKLQSVGEITSRQVGIGESQFINPDQRGDQLSCLRIADLLSQKACQSFQRSLRFSLRWSDELL